ncbi:hypothetical protein [uncultured Jannaschia sp.]|uniref:hypothetical protein n=1 Tax=uncultured Jannaschia sp. TaxID=293347 RepID=UPI00261BCB02|nr:hypothetical protein [uncultured Jannaschia sp.]
MRHHLIAVALLAVPTAPAVAQTASEAPDITCGAFLELEPEAQMSTMLALRAEYSGETITKAEEVEDATVLTGATEAGASGGADGGPTGVSDVSATPEAKQRLSGMRTSCMDVPDIPAMDALIAAHADYEPVFEPDPPAD